MANDIDRLPGDACRSILERMRGFLSQRLLSVLQLTRMARVFTAISNSLCALLLLAKWLPGNSIRPYVEPVRVIAIALMSIGMYGFGMSLNDIIDRRRDSQIASHRPLPSGRIGLLTAHVICVLLALTALLAGGFYAKWTASGPMSFLLLIWTASLIVFYDFAGKYLVWLGLMTLGLIRFFHALIPAPQVPLLWHPLLLLNHVTILSTVAYRLEGKRPPLKRRHWWGIIGALFLVDLICVLGVWWNRGNQCDPQLFLQSLWITPGLILPAGAVIAFIIAGVIIVRRSPDRRTGGQTLMLFGLLWLIVYDAAFVAGYVSWLAAGLLLLLLPAAYFSVQLMRWWSRLVALSQRPQYQRARE
jgi:4-hydroxybenzoate polyprenyltransferase